MKIEEAQVNKVLDSYKHADADLCVLIGKLRAAMSHLLSILQEVDKDSFQLSKNAFIILHNVLTAKTEDEVIDFVKRFKTQPLVGVAKELYFLSQQGDRVREAMALTQHVFARRGKGLAEGYEHSINKKVLLFRASNGTAKIDEAIALENEQQLAQKNTYKVTEFFLKYKVW